MIFFYTLLVRAAWNISDLFFLFYNINYAIANVIY